RPRDVATAFIGVASPDAAITLLPRLRAASGERITSFELIERFPLEVALAHTPNTRDPLGEPHASYVLVELSSAQPGAGLSQVLEHSLDAAMDDGLVEDAVFASSDKEAEGFWRIREGIVWAQAHYGASIKHDVSIPVSRVPAFLQQADDAAERVVPGIRPCAFGHIGDGNIHYNLTGPAGMDDAEFLAHRPAINLAVHDVVAGLDGSISAEHGLGQLRRDDIQRYKSPLELELMWRLKDSLDPRAIMNPGKLLPPR
ncbi:MAG: FAD-linked oxidase C-terminal domain-containing protein, partial [Alphaproteobacteria bacterium]